jgi:hypothetical protein
MSSTNLKMVEGSREETSMGKHRNKAVPNNSLQDKAGRNNLAQSKSSLKLKPLAIVLLSASIPLSTLAAAVPEVSAKTTRLAIISSLSGTVEVQKAGGSKSYQAYAEMSLNQGDHIVTGDNSSVILRTADQGDELTIGSNAEFDVTDLSADGDAKSSRFKIWAGSVWSKVKKLASADDQFQVETPTAVMGVRGTNVLTSVDSETGGTYVAVASGEVGFQPSTSANGNGGENNGGPSPGDTGDSGTTIGPSQQATLDPGEDPNNLDANKGVIDPNELVGHSDSAIIQSIVSSKDAIDQENQQFISSQQQQLEQGQGGPQGGSVVISNQTDLQAIQQNLDNLVGNVVVTAINQGVDPQGLQDAINNLNSNLPPGASPLDLNNVQPLNTNAGLDPNLETQRQQAQQEREQRIDEQKQQQQQQQQQAQTLVEQLTQKSTELQQQNQAAAEQKQQEAQSQVQTQQQQSSQNTTGGTGQATTGQPSGGTTGTTGGTTGGSSGGTGSTGGSGTGSDSSGGGGGGGSAPDTSSDDTTAPDKPVISSPTAAVIATSVPTISVAAETGSKIDVKQGNTVVATAAGKGGTPVNVSWNRTLTDGVYDLTVTATDSSGNVSAAANVPRFTIDTTAPTGTVGYSTTSPTNGTVTATLTTSEPVTITNNGGSATYTFAANGSFKLEFKDAAGNTGSATATVNNINKAAPVGTIGYSTSGPTNGSVFATLTADKQVTITNNGGSPTYTFTTNGSFTFEFRDDAGNAGSATATVSNIDTTAPAGAAGYSSTAPTAGPVTVTLTTSEPVTITNNGGSPTYTFTANGSFTYEFKDAAGNTGSTTASVSNIDPTLPMGTISYSTEEPTNENVTVTLTTNKQVTILNNGGSRTYTFTANGSFTFEFNDATGRTGRATATVNNIDKIAPTGTISYSSTGTTNGPVTATLIPSEPVTITNNGGLPTYTFMTNGSFTFEFKDAAGNSVSATATVSNIDKTAPIAPIIVSPAITGAEYDIIQPSLSLTVNAEAGSTIEVKENGSVLAQGFGNGDIGAMIPLTFGPGSHLLVLTATDAAGNVSAETSVTIRYNSATTNSPVAVTASKNAAGAVTIDLGLTDLTGDKAIYGAEAHVLYYYSDPNAAWTAQADGGEIFTDPAVSADNLRDVIVTPDFLVADDAKVHELIYAATNFGAASGNTDVTGSKRLTRITLTPSATPGTGSLYIQLIYFKAVHVVDGTGPDNPIVSNVIEVNVGQSTPQIITYGGQ